MNGVRRLQVLVAIVAIAVLTAGCASSTIGPPRDATMGGDLGEQRHEAGAVTIVASWLADPTPTARVALDTHSVDLDRFDLAQLARMRLDGGVWVAPTRWDAPTGGHHRAGTLTFGSLDPQLFAAARVVELEVRDVAVPSHLLRWERAR